MKEKIKECFKTISDKDLVEIIKLARKRDGVNLSVGERENIRGFIRIKISKFKKIGFRMELDFPFDINKEKIEYIKLPLNKMLEDISIPSFKEELHVGRSSVVCAFYKGDEEFALGFILETLINNSVNF